MAERELYDAKWITEVAKSACLRLNAEEAEAFARTVGAELSHLAELFEDGAISLSEDALDFELLREDRVGECLDAEALVSAAPRRNQTCFSVPGVLGEGGASS